jgi:hypothetical protein
LGMRDEKRARSEAHAKARRRKGLAEELMAEKCVTSEVGDDARKDREMVASGMSW